MEEKTASLISGDSWTGADVLAATDGRLVCGEPSRLFSAVGIDSRKFEPSSLFIAIVGKTHDGHGFCGQVVEAGGRGLLVADRSVERLPIDAWRRRSVFCAAVADTTRALGDLASWHRNRQSVKVAAITGSCGKTTTRDMTASVLRRRYRTLSSKKNFNNEIGLPLTLLDLAPRHEWAVAELGMNHLGEIARLGEICRPDIGVITNVGAAHLEGLGTVDNVAAAKAELLPAIGKGGTAVLNADDPRVRSMARQAKGRVLFFGESGDADIRSRNVRPSGLGTAFELVFPEGDLPVFLRGPGLFMVSNALAAAAVGYVAGLSPEEIRVGIETFEPVPGRMNLLETMSGFFVIDDTYNANPVSMTAAISTLASVKGEGRGMVVLGDMFELGTRSEEFHHALGVVAAQSGAGRVYATGTFAEEVAAGALEAYMNPEDVVAGSQADILADLKKHIAPGDWVLVKGSRAAEMEKIVRGLVAWAGGKKKKA
jgi:UDP-N-acetylmuramoyl-tripeptide--D-alanyl-D-alanine ligase